MKVIDVAAAVIFNDKGEVLIAQRAEPEILKGLWEFPGGQIERGESKEDALHREILEELSITIKIDFLIGDFSNTLNERTVRIFAFAAQALSNDVKVTDHLDVRWVQPSELKKYSLVPADDAIFPAYLALKKR
jgi:8-oxo-dGTP diphosphatase